jgi:chromosome segregation ATPase
VDEIVRITRDGRADMLAHGSPDAAAAAAKRRADRLQSDREELRAEIERAKGQLARAEERRDQGDGGAGLAQSIDKIRTRIEQMERRMGELERAPN